MKKKMLLFDLDGTLWDTLETTCVNANEFLKENGLDQYEVTLDTVKKTMGCNHAEAAFNYFPFAEKEIREEYLTRCSARNAKTLAKVGGKLYPKLDETLTALKEEYMLAIVSNCSNPYLEAFLSSSGLSDKFVQTLAAGSAKLSKAEGIISVLEEFKVMKKDAVYVGDTIKDWNAAKDAGIECVFCRYGFGDIPKAKYYVDNFEDLVEEIHKIEEEI